MTDRAMQPQSHSSDGHSPQPPCRFYLLGELRIAVAGEQQPAPPYRTHGLLASLLLHPHPQRRDRLIGQLYPEMPESAGRRRLSDLLWLLRRAMPALPLETTVREVHLPAESRWLDVEAFEGAAASDELRDWLVALDLYRGDLLETAYDDWLLEHREALYLEYVRLLHRASAQLLGSRQFERAVALAERLVAVEPYDEKALRTLMEGYRAIGRRGAALAVYEQFVARVADEFGVEPDPATLALAETIRRPDVASGADAGLLPADESSPEALLRRGREALEGGQRAVVEEVIERLRAGDFPHHADDACLLEIDLVIFYEEYARAGELLAACGGRRAPALARAAALSLATHDLAEAHSLASEALMLAHEAQDQQSELDALLVLAQTQRVQGRIVQAERSAEQASNLARATASPKGMVRASLVQGHGQILQGRYTQAMSLFREARYWAGEHGLRRLRADALRGISIVHCHRSQPLAALTSQLEELSIWRDLGLRSHEASALQNLATTYDHLGRSADSQRALEVAQKICEELGEPVRAAINQYHLAGNLLYQDDALAPRSIELARGALAIFRAHGQAGWEATALRWLGYAQWVGGRHADALESFEQAYQMHEQLGELGVLPELLAYQGLAHHGANSCEHAIDFTRRALWALAGGEVSDEVVPEIYYAHAVALAACGDDEQAGVYFRRAYGKLIDAAAGLEDEAARQTFFQHSPTTRRLMQEVYRRGIASPPTSGIISRQLPATRDAGLIRVKWTVDAGPADAVLRQSEGAIALRRSRLSRLIREAESQGASPTVAQLAEALGVSPRTIQRDLATRQ